MFASSQTSHQERRTAAVQPSERVQGRIAEVLEARPQERQKVADRVAYLFPRPETTEWDVSELSYDRRRRAEPQTELRVS